MRAIGPTAGFITGWGLILAYLTTGIAVVAGCANYATTLCDKIHLHIGPYVLYSIVAGLVWFIVYRDVRLSAQTMLLLEIASVGLILFLGLVLLSHKGFALETKKIVLQHLKNAPKQLQQTVEREFETLLIAAIEKAVNQGRPPELRFGGVSVVVGLATYNHWCNVKFQWPELVPTANILGIQLYEIRMVKRDMRIPLPNTFQPYVQVRVNYSAR